MPEERIVISGATGFLGTELVRVLLEGYPTARLVLLVREEPGKTAAERGEAVIRRVTPPEGREGALSRVETLAADVTQERCGLSEASYRRLAETATRVVHSAASVRFDHSLSEARRINVGGTRNILALAAAAHRAGSLRSIACVGTAYVAGERTGLVLEKELDAGQRFRNTYERTKFEAERLVRQSLDSLPGVILRPSIIVGDSRTGVTRSFKTLYWPLKIYARRLWRTVPGFPEAVVDVVPVDFVSQAAVRLLFDERALGSSLHLCAGPEGSATISEIAARAASFFGVRPPRYVDPDLFFALVRPLLFALLWGPKRRVLRDGRAYRSYFSMRMTFDTATAKALLAPAGLQPPRVTDYLDRLLAYCVETDWGRRAPAPGR
jgi:thioester reductase-like protein